MIVLYSNTSISALDMFLENGALNKTALQQSINGVVILISYL